MAVLTDSGQFVNPTTNLTETGEWSSAVATITERGEWRTLAAGGVNATVVAPTSVATALSPVASVTKTGLVSPAEADATANALVPVVSVTNSVTILPLPAAASAAALVPTVTATIGVIVSPGVATATAMSPLAVVTTVAPIPADAPALQRRRAPVFRTLTWTVDGQQVRMGSDWSANAAETGYDQMRGHLLQADWRRLTASGQGSVVRAWLDSGETLWEGRLSANPQLSGGVASIACSGYKVAAEKKTDRLLVQSRDLSQWVPLDSEPFVDGSGAPVYDHYKRLPVQVHHARLAWSIPPGTVVQGTANSRSGFGFYAPGVNLRHVSFVMNYGTGDAQANLEFQIASGVGPNGPLGVPDGTVQVSSGNVGSAHTVGLVGTNRDIVGIYLHGQSSGFTQPSGDVAAYALSQVRVNSDVTSADTFDASDLVAYIGTTLGFDPSGVVSSTFNILPFDQTSGSWSDAASSVAEMEDHYWRVTYNNGAGPLLEYAPYGTRTWTVFQTEGAVPNLVPLEVFNQCRVNYQTPAGVAQSVTVAASPDPLASVGITNMYEYDLPDRQSNSTLATAVANRLLTRYSLVRYSGTLEVVRAYDNSGRNFPQGILPGDTVTLADMDVVSPPTMRVTGVDYGPSSVHLSVEDPIDVLAILRSIPPHRRHHRRHHRH